jgi:hypothetical protein
MISLATTLLGFFNTHDGSEEGAAWAKIFSSAFASACAMVKTINKHKKYCGPLAKCHFAIPERRWQKNLHDSAEQISLTGTLSSSSFCLGWTGQRHPEAVMLRGFYKNVRTKIIKIKNV